MMISPLVLPSIQMVIVLATVSLDGTVKVWDAASGQEYFTLYGHIAPISDVTFSPGGDKLYTASLDGTVREYLMEIDQLFELARERIARELSQEECRHYLHVSRCPPSPYGKLQTRWSI